MAGLPKKYAKMGFKKGWASYKKSKGKSSTPKTYKAKTIKRRTTTMAKKKSISRKSKGLFDGLNKPMLGAGGVILYENFLSPYIPVKGVIKDVGELMAGLYLSKKQGFLGATGKSLVVLNSYQLLNGVVGNKLSGFFSQIGENSTENDIYGGIY